LLAREDEKLLLQTDIDLHPLDLVAKELEEPRALPAERLTRTMQGNLLV